MVKMRKMIKSLTVILIIVTSAWLGGIIPKQIGKITACDYVESNYPAMNLKFEKMEFSSAHGGYFAVFIDSGGELYNFLMTSKYLPTRVLFDPVKNHA